MKQTINYQGADISSGVKLFISFWKKRKGYALDTLTIGECLELLVGVTTNLHFEYSDGRFFNKIIINGESTIAWDGEELLDILFHEVVQGVRQQLNRAHTFNEEIV